METQAVAVRSLTSTASVEEILEVLKRDGCVIIRKLARPATMDDIARELEPFFGRTPNGEGYFVGRNTKRMGGLIVKSPTCRQLVVHPTILAVMDAILCPHCSSYRLNLTQAIGICPGEVEQIFHKDEELFPFKREGLECMANALWACDDFTEENGATRVVPGSHLREVDRTPPGDQVFQAVMPRGSVLIYLGSLTHSGGANRSDRPRAALTMSYALGWLRQAENQYLAVPPEVARNLPEQLQRLVGYAIHVPNLGWYEGQDPSVVLGSGKSDTLAAGDYMPPELEVSLKEHYEFRRAS